MSVTQIMIGVGMPDLPTDQVSKVGILAAGRALRKLVGMVENFASGGSGVPLSLTLGSATLAGQH